MERFVEIVTAIAKPLKSFEAFVIGITVAALGGWDWPIQMMVFLVVIDFISGTLAAYKHGEGCSEGTYWGIIKKMGAFAVVIMAAKMDAGAGTYFHAYDGGTVLRNVAIFAYIKHEIESNLENFDRIGIWVPPVIRRYLKHVNPITEKEE